MDITKLFTRNGQVTAAMLVDGDATYPVLIESLGNTVILPTLLESGWHLTALPLTLNKNGVDLMSLPKEEWTAAMEEQYGQDMYDMIGEPMPMEERKAHLYRGGTSSTFAGGQYTINTRDELIAYLNTIKRGVPDTDFLPLNYFVHPNARFSLDEYLREPAYSAIIEDRRRLSYTRYKKLCAFLKQHGMPDNFNDVDFLRAYMQWGVDGIQFTYRGEPGITKVYSCQDYRTVFNSQTGMTNVEEINTYTNRLVYAIVVRTQDGMKVIPPKGYTEDQLFSSDTLPRYDFEIQRPRARFTLTMEEDGRLRTLPLGGAMVVKRKVVHQGHRWECAVDHNAEVITADFGAFKFGNLYTAPGISISTPSGSPMPSSLVGDTDAIRVSGFVMAVAELIVKSRSTDTDASLYKALLENGYSDYSALMYYINSNGYFNDRNPYIMSSDSGMDYEVILTADMVKVFLEARKNPDTYEEVIATMPVVLRNPDGNREELISMVADLFTGVLEGTVNNQRLDDAYREEASVKAMSYYTAIRAITLCTDTTIDDIYAQVKNWEVGKPVVIDFDGGSIQMDGFKLERVKREYATQLRITRYEQVCNATYYTWVDGLIKEFGPRDKDGIIGFYCTVLNMTSKKAKEALDVFAGFYAKLVLADIEPLKAIDKFKYERLAYTFFHTPGQVALPDNAMDDTPAGHYIRIAGVAKFFAASMLMQSIKQNSFRISTPKLKNKLMYVSDYPELVQAVEQAKKCLLHSGRMFYCDLESYCDRAVDDAPFPISYTFYTVNAVITPDSVNPRIHFQIPVYDPAGVYCYDVHESNYEAGIIDWLPGPVDARFYNKAIMRSDYAGERDLLKCALLDDSKRSKLFQYFKECYALAVQWKKDSDNQLDGFTPISSMPDVEVIDSGYKVQGPKGLPGFNLGKWESYKIPHRDDEFTLKHAVREVKRYTGVTCEEYSKGVVDFDPPVQAGHKGLITVINDSIYTLIYGEKEAHNINASDVANLDENVYPVKHLYGPRYVFLTTDGRLHYVEV